MTTFKDDRRNLRSIRNEILQDRAAFREGRMSRLDLLANIKSADSYARSVAVDLALGSEVGEIEHEAALRIAAE